SGAAAGIISTPSQEAVAAEYERGQLLVRPLKPIVPRTLITTQDGKGLPGTDTACESLLLNLGIPRQLNGGREKSPVAAEVLDSQNAEARMKRQFEQILGHTQYLMQESPYRRAEFWAKADASSVDKWRETTRWYRDYFWDEVIG